MKRKKHNAKCLLVSDFENVSNAERCMVRLFPVRYVGIDKPCSIINTLVFLFGKHCALRGQKQHRQLNFASMKLQSNGKEFLTVQLAPSKTNTARLGRHIVKPKVCTIYALQSKDPSTLVKCPVYVYKEYILEQLMITKRQLLV